MNESFSHDLTLPEKQDATFETVHTSGTVMSGDDGPKTLTQWRVEEFGRTSRSEQQKILPQFQLIQRIGRGGMGEVWEAVQTSLDRLVAVKFIAEDVALRAANPEDRVRLRRIMEHEAVIAARLEHPNIVPIHDQGSDEKGDPLIAMKRIHGQPWRDMLRAEFDSSTTPELLGRHLPIFLNVCQAVAFAHSRGIIHRDIKPAQVMVGEYGEVLLVDWGLAIDLEDGIESDTHSRKRVRIPTRLTASSPSGTAVLMSPEQTEATAEKLGRWTDIYLLSGTLYFMLTGTYPHQSSTSHGAFAKAMKGDIEDPRKRAPERLIPDELAEVCLKGLSANPEDRFTTVEELITALEDFQSGTYRRRRASAIIETIRENLKSNPEGYSVYSGLLGQIAEAAGLWPEHPHIPLLRKELHARYARRALLNNDLVLADLQARNLPEGDERTSIDNEIRSREIANLKQRRYLRLALGAAIALLATLFFSSAVFALVFRDERDQTQRALQVSQTRSNASQELVNFMLSDLSGALDPAVKRDGELIDIISEKVTTHYRNLDTSVDSAEVKLKHADALQPVAYSLMDLGQVRAGLELYLESIGIYEELAPKSKKLVDALMQATSCYVALGETDAAAALEARARALLPETHPPDHSAHILGLIRHAQVARQKADWDLAEELWLEAIERAEAAGNEAYAAQSNSLLAGLYRFRGEREKAQEMFEAAVGRYASQYGENSKRASLAKIDLANIYKDRGRMEEGLELAVGALKNLEELLGPNHPELTGALSYIGSYNYINRNYEKAREYYNRSIAINTENNGEEYYYNAPLYQSLAVISIGEGKWEDAQVLLEKALKLQNKEHGELSVYHVELLMSLSAVYDNSGQSHEAEMTLLDVMKILEQHFNPEHPNNGLVRANLGYLYARNSRYADAEPFLAAGLPILEKAYGGNHPFLNGVREYIIQNYCWWSLEIDGDERIEKCQKALAVWDEMEPQVCNGTTSRLITIALIDVGRTEDADEMMRYLVDNDLFTRWVFDTATEHGYVFDDETTALAQTLKPDEEIPSQ